MKRIGLVLTVVAAACVSAWAGDDKKGKETLANDLLTAGLDQAKKEEKRVFLVFGSPACGWCKVFEKYHDDAQVRRVLAQYLVFVKVDTVKNPGGDKLYRKYGTDRGVPAWTILDATSKVLADSGDGRDNVGFPYEPREVTHYFAALKKAGVNLTDAEIDLLRGGLKQVSPRPEKTEKTGKGQ